MVVMIIIGVLAAIAIPLYQSQIKASFDASAKTDLRNAITDLQGCFADNGAFPSYGVMGTSMAFAAFDACSATNIPSTGTWTIYYPNTTTGGATSYILYAYAPKGTGGEYWCFASSSGGGLVRMPGRTPTAYATHC